MMHGIKSNVIKVKIKKHWQTFSEIIEMRNKYSIIYCYVHKNDMADIGNETNLSMFIILGFVILIINTYFILLQIKR